MSKDKENRYKKAKEVLEDLDRWEPPNLHKVLEESRRAAVQPSSDSHRDLAKLIQKEELEIKSKSKIHSPNKKFDNYSESNLKINDAVISTFNQDENIIGDEEIDEKIIEIVKRIESNPDIAFIGGKPPAKNLVSAKFSERLKRAIKSGSEKVKKSIKTGKKFINRIRKSMFLKNNYKIIILASLIAIVLIFTLFQLFKPISYEIAFKLPADSILHIQCEDFSSFADTLALSPYFRSSKNFWEFLNSLKKDFMLEISEKLDISKSDAGELIQSIEKIAGTLFYVEGSLSWGFLFQSSSNNQLAKLKEILAASPTKKYLSLKVSSTPYIFIIIDDSSFALVPNEKIADALIKAVSQEDSNDPKPNLTLKYFDDNISVFINDQKFAGLLSQIGVLPFENTKLLEGISNLVISKNQGENTATEFELEINDKFPLGQIVFDAQSDFNLMKFVPVDARKVTACKFSNISAAVTWYKNYFSDGLMTSLLTSNSKILFDALSGEAVVFKLSDGETINLLGLRKEFKKEIIAELQNIFTGSVSSEKGIFAAKGAFWCVENDVLVLSPNSIGTIQNCVNNWTAKEFSSICQHEKFKEVRSKLPDKFASVQLYTLQELLKIDAQTILPASVKQPFLASACFYEKENGNFAYRISIKISELLILLLLHERILSLDVNIKK